MTDTSLPATTGPTATPTESELASTTDRPATKAAASVIAENSTHLSLPGIGQLRLPPPDQLAFLGGIAALAVMGMVEWPVAAVLTVGHLLAHNRHHELLSEFGEALDEA